MKKLYIRDVIGWHITADQFTRDLDKALESNQKIIININSGGGSVYQGMEMANAIRTAQEEGANITLRNVSIAGSMATFIMSKAKKGTVEMDEHSIYFVHLPSGISFGNEDKMKKELEHMAKIGDMASSIYSNRTGMSEKICLELMKENLWLTAKEAKEMGFVDRIVSGGKEKKKAFVPRSMKEVYNESPMKVAAFIDFENQEHNTNLPYGKSQNYNSNETQNESWKNFVNFLG